MRYLIDIRYDEQARASLFDIHCHATEVVLNCLKTEPHRSGKIRMNNEAHSEVQIQITHYGFSKCIVTV